MQAPPSGPRLDQIALKWHDLAQRRLEYYSELYRSGRWQIYYTQELFAVRMLDVIAAARKFAQLAGLPQGEAQVGSQVSPLAAQATQRALEQRPEALRPAA